MSKETVLKTIKSALKELNSKVNLKDEEIESRIELPTNSEQGDFAFPCFFLAGKLKIAPHLIAMQIRERIKKIPGDFEKIESSGAYINFFLNKTQLAEDVVQRVLDEGENYGKSDVGKGQKALIEHTSINPNASPHLGRARNAIIGDSIVKIFNFLNYKTEVHYYVNDVSKQIAMLVLAGADKLTFEKMLKEYVKISAKVKKSKAIEQQVFDLLYKFEHNNPEVVRKFNKVTDICVKGQAKILGEMKIYYDVFDYESKYNAKSKEILPALEKTKKLFKDKDGRMVLNQEGTSVDGMMKAPMLVLTRNDGTGLYPLRDIAYTLDKIKIAKKNVLVLGEDQKLYFKQVNEAMKLLGFQGPEVVHYSFILLASKGKAKKMSTRKGDVVLLEDFMADAIDKAKKEIAKRKTKGDAKKVGIGAVKYTILKNHNNKMILFNLEDALTFEGDTGPYLQYSYARASSILKKAKAGTKERRKVQEEEDENEVIQEKEKELIKKLGEFPDVVMKAYTDLMPSYIANYSFDLSQVFNEFYHTCPVIGSENEEFRLELVEAFRIVLKNSLGLLGIEVMDEM